MASPFRKDPNATPAEAAAFNSIRPITAAATRMRLDDKGEAEQFRLRQGSQTAVWQSAAWEYYDAIGEIKYAFGLFASVMSRVRIYPAYVVSADSPPSHVDDVDTLSEDVREAGKSALARVTSSQGGQSSLLRDAALVASECADRADDEAFAAIFAGALAPRPENS